MNKKKLIELRCKAWGITEDEYYCNQCSDFSLEDMARAYRRGKNKGIEFANETTKELEKENKELKTVKIPQLERRIASIRGCHSVDAKKLNARIEQVERLKQENAELREKVAEHKKASVQRGWSILCYKDKYDTCLRENTGLKIHNAYVEKKLAEAKELLKRWERLYNTNTVKGIIADTEHFLKEE